MPKNQKRLCPLCGKPVADLLAHFIEVHEVQDLLRLPAYRRDN